MAQIAGMTITLWDKVQKGTDSLNAPIYEETAELVDNVIVAPVSSDEVVDSLNLYGKKAVYKLGIPKGDTHVWEDRKVSFFGRDFQTFGIALEGIEANIPLQWNKQIMVATYE